MNSRSTVFLSVLLAMLLLLGGCAQYRVTQELNEVIDTQTICSVGEVNDALAADMEAEDKPTLEEIEKLREQLQKRLEKKDIFDVVAQDEIAATYEVTGDIIEFKRGNGVVRFFIGFGLGNSKIIVDLKLRNVQTGEVVFAGNFKQVVASGFETGDKIFERVAKDFAKELKKQMEKVQGRG